MRASKTFFLLIAVILFGGYIWFVERNRLSPAEQKAVDRQAFDLSMDRVDRIGIRTASLEAEMVFDGTYWMLTEPKGARASQPVVRQLLARFRSLSRGEFITPADMRARSLTLADFGLEVPRVLLTLGVEEERRVYSIGSPNPLGTALYVKEESSQNVMLVSSDLLEILPPDAVYFRDPEIFPIAPSEVRELALVSSEGTVRLQRESTGWSIQNPVRAEADPGKVENLLAKLSQARIEAVVNRPGPEEMDAFMSSGDPEVIRIWPNTQTVPIEMQVGGIVPGNAERCYARIMGQEGLIEVSKGLKLLAQTPALGLRDRTVFGVPADSVTSLRILEGDQEVLLVKKKGGWHVEEPFDLPASSAKVQQVIAQWNDALIEAFLPLEQMETEVNPMATVSFSVEGKEGSSSFALLGNEVPPGRALIQKEGSEELFQVVPDVVKYFPREALDYVSKQILPFDPALAVRVSLEQDGNTITFVRETPSLSWTKTSGPEATPAEPLQSLLSEMTSLFADSVIALPPDIGADPDYRFSIGLGGETPENLTVTLTGSVIWVQGRNVAYTISETKRSRLVSYFSQAVSNAERVPHEAKEAP